MAKQEREVKAWITVNGHHVPVFEGETAKDAVGRLKFGNKSKRAVIDRRDRTPVADERSVKVTKKVEANQKSEGKQTETQKQITKDLDEKEKQITENKKQAATAKDVSGNTVSTKGAHNYAKEQSKSMEDLANDIKGNAEAKKAVNEMLNNGVDWDNAVAIAHKQFIGNTSDGKQTTDTGRFEDKANKTLAGIKFTRSGSTLEDMDNAGKLIDVLDEAPVGAKIESSGKFGTVGYKKVGPNTWEYIASGLYGEAGGSGKRYDLDAVSARLATAMSTNGLYRFVKRGK